MRYYGMVMTFMSVPFSPGPSLTHQAPARCLPLPEGGTVLTVLLLQHAVVTQILLAASAGKRLDKLLLRGRKEEKEFTRL